MANRHDSTTPEFDPQRPLRAQFVTCDAPWARAGVAHLIRAARTDQMLAAVASSERASDDDAGADRATTDLNRRQQ